MEYDMMNPLSGELAVRAMAKLSALLFATISRELATAIFLIIGAGAGASISV